MLFIEFSMLLCTGVKLSLSLSSLCIPVLQAEITSLRKRSSAPMHECQAALGQQRFALQGSRSL